MVKQKRKKLDSFEFGMIAVHLRGRKKHRVPCRHSSTFSTVFTMITVISRRVQDYSNQLIWLAVVKWDWRKTRGIKGKNTRNRKDRQRQHERR